MKKILFLVIALLSVSFLLMSCDKEEEKQTVSTAVKETEEKQEETTKETDESEKAEESEESTGPEEETTETEPETTKKPVIETSTLKKDSEGNYVTTQKQSSDLYSPDNYAFVKKFEAPVGNYRKIVKDYMLKMANIEWTPTKTFTVTWKNQGDFGVNLKYTAGTKYKGLIYSRAGSDFYQFEQYVQNGKWTYDGPTYYEEVVGNHCSHSMRLAFQQLVNFPMSTAMKPVDSSHGMVKFPTALKTPTKTSWISQDLFDTNGKTAIYDAYSHLQTGDILYKNISGSGHTRLVSRVDATNKKIYTIEQTNQFESTSNKNFVKNNGYDTTWWIDHVYTFDQLWNTKFMPCTLSIYSSGEKSKDAFICFDGNLTSQTIKSGLTGKVISNFPINFIRMTVKNQQGTLVRDKLLNIVNDGISTAYNEEYKIPLSQYNTEIIGSLPSGSYTFTLTAGIARGSCTISSFTFTK